jgi:hypothetical protein
VVDAGWCNHSRYQVEPEMSAQARCNGADITVPD